VLEIDHPPNLTEEQRAIALRYIGGAHTFSSAEWAALFDAFNSLARSTVVVQGHRLTFREFYERVVDLPRSDLFISEILNLGDVRHGAARLQASHSREVFRLLRSDPYELGDSPDSELLLSYCLYWWASFARGYAFEIEVTRDLEASGIRFEAHDIRVRSQRLSPCDLTLLGMRGDIKTSTYFLYVARSFPLSSDFYIARLFDTAARKYTWVVISQAAAWDRIDGKPRAAALADAARLLPEVVTVKFMGYDLVVSDYAIWKQKVLQKQGG